MRGLQEWESLIDYNISVKDEDEHVMNEHVTVPTAKRLRMRLGKPADGLVVIVRKKDGVQVSIPKSSLDRLAEEHIIDRIMEGPDQHDMEECGHTSESNKPTFEHEDWVVGL